LLKSLMENMHNKLSGRKAVQLFHDLRRTANAAREFQTEEFQRHVLATELKVLALLYRRFPNQEKLERSLAGILPIEEELLVTEEAGSEGSEFSLTEQLIQHPKTFQIGTLIKPLWSGLTIPSAHSRDHENLFGGVTDLSNKGELQQLLLTEFAHDDLVFLSRLANREALYYRRDVPQGNPGQHRIFLLDISLRMWGVAKVVAWSSLLATVTHPRYAGQYTHSVFVLGQGYHPTSIDSLPDILKSTARLSATYDCLNGFCDFFKDQVAQAEKAEVFFLTTRDAWKDQTMEATVEQYRQHLNYLMVFDEDGLIDLFQYHTRNRKHLKTLQLPLAKLWKNPPGEHEEVKSTMNIAADQLPILVPVDKFLGFRRAEGRFVYKLVKKYGLFRNPALRKQSSYVGWELLLKENVVNVQSADFEVGILSNGQEILLMYRRAYKLLIMVNLYTRERKEVFFANWQHHYQQNFFFIDGYFYHQSTVDLWQIATDGGHKPVRDKEHRELLSAKIKEKIEQSALNTRYGYPYGNSVLLKIKKLSINSRRHLVINQFELFPD
ncbi:MAG: hypothetical protein AAFO69_19310, partial [Bacteroidota bacterium]